MSGDLRAHPRRPGPLACFLQHVGIALDRDDLAVVDEAVDEGDDTCGAGEELTPLGEGAVGGDGRGSPALVAAVDDLEGDVGVAVAVNDLAELVDHEHT